MGAPKALLTDPDGRFFVLRIVSAMHDAGIGDIVVVTGKHHDEIAEAIGATAGVRVARNPDPSRGQLSSLHRGMDEVVEPHTAAIVVTLVDVPMARSSTIAAVVDGWIETDAPIVRPRMGERRGHPVLFDRRVFQELRQAPLADGARAVLRAHRAEIVEVEVDDPGCIVDVDTPAEYDALIRQNRQG